jgi:prepilin-type N-terminal cleavage/methylation domain-containing protein
MKMIKNSGITLIELIVAISIVGVLAVAFAFEFQGWINGYKVESEIKEIYVDLMNARARAMQKNRIHFVGLTTTQYTIYEDTDPAPDGNGILATASDTRVLQKSLNPDYPITWSDLADTQIDFTKKGLSNDNKTICIFTDFVNNYNPINRSPDGISDNNPDYDCMVISATRIILGKLTTQNTAGGACNSDNCNIE